MSTSTHYSLHRVQITKRARMALVLGIFVALGSGYATPVRADAPLVSLTLDAATIMKGYTAESSDQAFRMGIWPGVLDLPATLTVRRLTDPARPVPAGSRVVSDFYEFDFLRDDGNIRALVLSKPYTLALKFTGDGTWRKSIRYYDDNRQSWVALPSTTDVAHGYVRAITHLPYSRVAVFEEDVKEEGRASYYTHPKYPGQLIAASRDYAFGTQLNVQNIENGKSVVVTVRDYGPNAAIHPDRIIDISKTAFAAIGDVARGTLPVRVTTIAPKVLGASTVRVQAPAITSKAAMVIDADTGRMLYEKNPDTVLPIASLTKLLTAAVFLDAGVSWDKVMTYESADSAIGSRLVINPGETLTVKNLFYTSLTGSANNATHTLVRSTGMSRDQFVAKMNTQAKTWGTTYSSFADVTGLTEHNVSTAREYAMIARQAMKRFDILSATTMPAYGFTTINSATPHTIKNRNKMITTPWIITGTKTGYTDEALYTLATRARKIRGGREVLVVVLGSSTDAGRYADTEALLSYGHALLENGQ